MGRDGPLPGPPPEAVGPRAHRSSTPPPGWVPPEPGATARLRRTFSREDVLAFAALSGDRNPLHFDEEAARASTFGRLIVHGGLTTGLFNALVAEQLPGPGSVFLHQEWDYPAAVGIGEEVVAEVEVIEARADKPVTRLRCVARLADGTEVLRGESVVYTVPLPAPRRGVGPGSA